MRLGYCAIIVSLATLASSGSASPPAAWLEPPPKQSLDYLERRLASAPCIGNMRRWERRYAYRERIQGSVYSIDYAVVDFQLREAGRFGFKPGRAFIDGPLVVPDDRAYRIALGSFDFRRRKLTLTTCSQNLR